MSNVKKERDVIINYSYPDVFNATLDFANREKWTIKYADMNTGYIKLSTPISLISWGENVEIYLRPDQQNVTALHIISDSTIGTTLIDFGKNKKNIDNLVNNVNILLFNHYNGRQY